jgi:hypothetical protein
MQRRGSKGLHLVHPHPRPPPSKGGGDYWGDALISKSPSIPLYERGKRYLLPLPKGGLEEFLDDFKPLNCYFGFLPLWKAFKTKFKPDGDFRSKLNTRMRSFCEGNFKGLCPFTTPFAKKGYSKDCWVKNIRSDYFVNTKKGL